MISVAGGILRHNSDGVIRRARQLITHERYNPADVSNDIAVIKVGHRCNNQQNSCIKLGNCNSSRGPFRCRSP